MRRTISDHTWKASKPVFAILAAIVMHEVPVAGGGPDHTPLFIVHHSVRGCMFMKNRESWPAPREAFQLSGMGVVQ